MEVIEIKANREAQIHALISHSAEALRDSDASSRKSLARERSLVAEPGKPTIIMTQSFDAPRRLVFDAWTRPEHLRHWWGRRTSSFDVCDVDLRLGGGYRFVLRGADGQKVRFKGEYYEVLPPERLVYTFIWDVEGFRDRGALVTLLFEEDDARTKLTSTTVHRTVEDRDGHFKMGSEAMRETMDRLAEHLTAIMQSKGRS